MPRYGHGSVLVRVLSHADGRDAAPWDGRREPGVRLMRPERTTLNIQPAMCGLFLLRGLGSLPNGGRPLIRPPGRATYSSMSEVRYMSNVIPFRYQGQPVRFNTDGWLHATELAERFGKHLRNWLDSAETLEYVRALDELQSNSDEPSKISNVRDSGYLKSRRGNGGGTWLHPKLAVMFARWLNAKFAVWCDLQIDALIHGDIPAQQHFDRACKALASGRQVASLSGKQLAEWRSRKPRLEREVEHWRDQLQLTLGFEAA